MRKALLASALAWIGLSGMQAPPGAAPAPISLWRLDCGDVHVSDLDVFSDAYLYAGQQKDLTDSCYLIRHGDRYLLWDTGLPGALVGTSREQGPFRMTLRASVRDQLARINVRPEQITFVGLSHGHFDHIGQAADFPRAILLVGAPDWEEIRGAPTYAAQFTPWIQGGSTVQTVTGDHDVFGDGSVVMLNLPGHTPGHHALLVRLRGRAPVILSGDQFHFTEQVRNNGVPGFNADRADTLASSQRLLAIADSLDAELIIQHEPADIAKLPAFPEAAR